MKILLYRKRAMGKPVQIPGKRPEEELETLLGGATAMEPLRDGLVLVKLMDAEKLGLPRQYFARRPWADLEYIHGDCAIVAADYEGRYIDISEEDMLFAICSVLPVEGPGA